MAQNSLQKLGRTIKSFRLEKDLSQEELADLCGIHRTYISDVELGKRNISFLNIEKIASALGIKTSELLDQFDKIEDVR